MIFRFGVVILCSIAFVALGSAQETETTINKSLIPLQANELSKFVPPGWKIEEKLTGDLNGDSLLDFALKLIENKPEKDQSGDPRERSRALLIVLQSQDGKLARAREFAILALKHNEERPGSLPRIAALVFFGFVLNQL